MKSLCSALAIAAIPVMLTGSLLAAQQPQLDYQLKLEITLPEAEGKGSWFQPRPVAIPGAGQEGKPAVVMTIQKAIGSDFFSGLSVMRHVDPLDGLSVSPDLQRQVLLQRRPWSMAGGA